MRTANFKIIESKSTGWLTAGDVYYLSLSFITKAKKVRNAIEDINRLVSNVDYQIPERPRPNENGQEEDQKRSDPISKPTQLHPTA